jgi:hypothetical protein
MVMLGLATVLGAGYALRTRKERKNHQSTETAKQ